MSEQGYRCVRETCAGKVVFEGTGDPEYPFRMTCEGCYLQTSEYVSKERAWASWFQRDKDEYVDNN